MFAYVTTDGDNRVVRMTFDGNRLSAPKPILTGIPNGFIHDGGRLQFAPDGNLFVSTGETGNRSLAQDPDSLGGKILRITERGKPAPGNPDPGSPIWTIGHRNVQGLAFDDRGNLWASEFGDNTFDELNLIQKANNYGWPEVEGKGDQDRYRNPQVVWSTDEASPSGLAFLDGHLWLGALRGNRLWRIDVEGQRASEPTDFFVGEYGRIRTVVAAPDGNLWVTTSNRDGRGDPAPRGRPDPAGEDGEVARRRAERGSRRRRRSGQLLEDQLADPAGIGLTAHLLHHRADQRTGRGDLAVADLVGDVGVRGDRGVDGRGEGTLVGDHGEATAGDHLVGRALAGEDPVEDLACQLVVDRLLVDERLHPGHVGRGHRQRGQLGRRSRWRAGRAHRATTCGRPAARRRPRSSPRPARAPRRRSCRACRGR